MNGDTREREIGGLSVMALRLIIQRRRLRHRHQQQQIRRESADKRVHAPGRMVANNGWRAELAASVGCILTHGTPPSTVRQAEMGLFAERSRG